VNIVSYLGLLVMPGCVLQNSDMRPSKSVLCDAAWNNISAMSNIVARLSRRVYAFWY